MPLTLRVDGERWRARMRSMVADSPGMIVPVAKGNGYGFGTATLAAEASKLGVETMAVGEHEEVATVSEFAGDVLVLSPWRPWVGEPNGDDRIVHTVSRLDDLTALASSGARPRIVIEALTSMRRHGIEPRDLGTAVAMAKDVRLEGFAFHLPLAGDHTAEVRTLAQQALAAARHAGIDIAPIWLSHVTPETGVALAEDLGTEVKLRIGTALWLGDRSLLRPTSTVLDVHDVRRGDRYGYRQRRASRNGLIAVVSGGTAHGIALEAPSSAASIRQRAISLAKGGLEAVGRALSPFRMSGQQCWFAEPPHMQCSMIWLPSGAPAPEVGDEVEVDVRFTTTSFDDVEFVTS